MPELLSEDGPVYDFLLNFLLAAVGEDGLASLHGLKEQGERSKTLLVELRWMREFYYGLHLLSAEDIGMAPALRPDEPVDRPACEAKATEWLASYDKDSDLAVDTRVSVPLYFDIRERKTRLWATIGVRLAKLDVSYAKPPKIKPAEGTGGVGGGSIGSARSRPVRHRGRRVRRGRDARASTVDAGGIP